MRGEPSGVAHAATSTLDLKPSRLLAGALLLIGTLALVSLAALDVDARIRAVLALAVLGCLTQALLKFLGRGSITSIRLLADGTLEAGLRGGGEVVCAIDGTPALLGPLVVVPLREKGGARRSLVVLPDALPPAGVRALRLWLNWGPAPGLGAGRNSENPPST